VLPMADDLARPSSGSPVGMCPVSSWGWDGHRETMAMIMILGNAAQLPHSILDSTRTLTTNIGSRWVMPVEIIASPFCHGRRSLFHHHGPEFAGLIHIQEGQGLRMVISRTTPATGEGSDLDRGFSTWR